MGVADDVIKGQNVIKNDLTSGLDDVMRAENVELDEVQKQH